MHGHKILRLIVVGLLILLGIACAYWFFWNAKGIELRQNPQVLRQWVEANRVLVVAAFLLAYIAMSLLCMPVWWLQVLAGYSFGVWVGILLIQASAAIAAVITMHLSQWLAGAYVRQRLEGKEERLRQLNEKLGHNGLLAVMMVRLLQVIPFGLSNYLFGATRISTRDVALGSLLGGMPAASIYATLGANPALFKDVRFLAILIALNLLFLLPLLLRYLQPQWFRRIGVE